MIDLLADLDRPPDWWGELYAALASGGPVRPGGARCAAGAARGRADGPGRARRDAARRGPDGLDGLGIDPAASDLLGLRLVHPDAAHPVLLRLGAAQASARTVLERPELRAAVEGSWDHEDPAGLAQVGARPGRTGRAAAR